VTIAVPMCLFALLTIRRLVKTGTSQNLRRKIIGRNAFQLILNILFVLNEIMPNNDESYGQFTIYISIVGLISAIVRLQEPFVWQTIKKKFYCKNSYSAHNYSSDSLNSFVNSAMNIEFVYVVLVGIRAFMQETIMSNGVTSTNSISLSKIEIEDITRWDAGSFMESEGSRINKSTVGSRDESMTETESEEFGNFEHSIRSTFKVIESSTSINLKAYFESYAQE